MPATSNFPLGGNGDILQDLVRRIEILEGRSRAIQAGAITVIDQNGNTQVVLGLLPDGTYGMAVNRNDGSNVLVDINASSFASAAGTATGGGGTTTTTAWTAITPTCNFTTGKNGTALILMMADINAAGNGQLGYAIKRVSDGTILVGPANLSPGEIISGSGQNVCGMTFTFSIGVYTAMQLIPYVRSNTNGVVSGVQNLTVAAIPS